MAKNKAKKYDKANKIDLTIPRQRGCLSCNRWDTFMKKVWEEEHEICPESGCVMINFETPPEKDA